MARMKTPKQSTLAAFRPATANKTFIYGLRDPRGGDVRYVGKSDDRLRTRALWYVAAHLGWV